MVDKGEIGNIKVKDHVVEWKIPDIFSYTVEGHYYRSPCFTVSKCYWYLSLYLRKTDNNSQEYISLYHFNKDNKATGAIYCFGVKKSDGTINKVTNDLCWIFNGTGYGTAEFFKKSDLLRRKSELAPSDDLTVTCTLWVCKDSDCTTRTNGLSNDLLELFTSKQASDVTLQVNGEKFQAHKVILIARSPVFKTMFEVPMKKKATGVVVMEDCDPRAFEAFLEYLYSGRVEKLSVHALELYEIAHQYEVKELQLFCIIALMKNLCLDNMCDVAILADMYKEKQLKTKVQDFFNKNYKDIFSTDHWKSLLRQKSSLANELLTEMAINLNKK